MSHGPHGVSNHWQLDSFFIRLFRPTKQRTHKSFALLVFSEATVTCDQPFPSQRASIAEAFPWRRITSHIAKTSTWHESTRSMYNQLRTEGICYLVHGPVKPYGAIWVVGKFSVYNSNFDTMIFYAYERRNFGPLESWYSDENEYVTVVLY